jgi:hypothetical protein
MRIAFSSLYPFGEFKVFDVCPIGTERAAENSFAEMAGFFNRQFEALPLKQKLGNPAQGSPCGEFFVEHSCALHCLAVLHNPREDGTSEA